nr:hypothetical transcript [Hymenolepis microstoma]
MAAKRELFTGGVESAVRGEVYPIKSPLVTGFNLMSSDMTDVWLDELIRRLDTVSDDSSPFPPEGYIGGMLVGRILLTCEDASPGNRVRYTV